MASPLPELAASHPWSSRPAAGAPATNAPATNPPAMNAPAMNAPAMNAPAMNALAMNALAMNAEHDAWHRLVIFGRPEQVSSARAFIRRVLGLGHPGAERATLLTSELVTNSVNHSNSRLDGGVITVTVRAAADRVRVEVRDEGGPTAPTLRCDDDLAEAGRGLRLVEAYSVTWGYHRNGTATVTWFESPPEPLP